MIKMVISGGQTGADQAGWRAAQAAGIETGGYMPRGFRTEDGPIPMFADLYGAAEHASLDYPPRTRANAAWADATLWFGKRRSPGYWCTRKACEEAGRPFLEVCSATMSHADVAAELTARGCEIINIAGNSESKSPGIGAAVERFLREVFRIAQAGELENLGGAD